MKSGGRVNNDWRDRDPNRGCFITGPSQQSFLNNWRQTRYILFIVSTFTSPMPTRSITSSFLRRCSLGKQRQSKGPSGVWCMSMREHYEKKHPSSTSPSAWAWYSAQHCPPWLRLAPDNSRCKVGRYLWRCPRHLQISSVTHYKCCAEILNWGLESRALSAHFCSCLNLLPLSGTN